MNKPHEVMIPKIDMDLVRIRAALPKKLSDLSRHNVDIALSLLRDWGDGNKPIKEIYNETLDILESTA